MKALGCPALLRGASRAESSTSTDSALIAMLPPISASCWGSARMTWADPAVCRRSVSATRYLFTFSQLRKREDFSQVESG